MGLPTWQWPKTYGQGNKGVTQKEAYRRCPAETSYVQFWSIWYFFTNWYDWSVPTWVCYFYKLLTNLKCWNSLRAYLLTPLDTSTVWKSRNTSSSLRASLAALWSLKTQDWKSQRLRNPHRATRPVEVNVLNTLVIHDSSMCISYMPNSFISILKLW